MEVKIVYWGPARTWAGVREERLHIDGERTLGAAADRLYELHVILGDARRGLRFVVNGRFSDESVEIHDGDEIGVMPPVSGGMDEDYVAVQAVEIDIAGLRERVAGNGACGGVVVFEGLTREETHEQHGPLVRLAYEAPQALAVSEMDRLCVTARSRFEIKRVAMVHREGDVGVGEASVAIAVGAAHRGPAFEACRWLIDALKKEVPIWKQEVWSDGATTWADPTKGDREKNG